MRIHPRATLALLVVLSVVAVGCAVTPTPAPAQPQPTAAPAEAQPTMAEEQAPAESELRVAALFPGVITDADYNTLGYLGLTAAEADLGVDTAYSESVPVPDVERVMREYIDDGFNVIWTHGGQFLSQTQSMAEEFPDVYFIAESDAPPEGAPDNLWVIDRNFQVGFYPLGALAAKLTQTGRIGYIGGLTLPFSYAEVHAMQQAISDLGADIELRTVWAGDFNDPTRARQLTDQMLAEDVDVVVGSMNLGMFGLFEAVKGAEGDVWATAKYTDKSTYAPDHYVTSVLYDFAGPIADILQRIQAGERGDYYPLGFDTGVAIQFPLQNVPEGLTDEIQQIVDQIEGGEIEVVKDTTPIE